ncbi:probable glutathione peroxidase 3, mitochondrial [Chenopodium quinoa]|uniref:probable glutathione peroxidase 3, mitochondrial n=1 Tax=Chenopodium quinoa TaxID=63459 RepID=UPI000B7932B9|nr:probable glutathione peroxidase 3, mitochondrial [Chenopodium quinoa]
MRSLYKKYKDQVKLYVDVAIIFVIRFEILAFPCNQFGWQEPGSNEEINEAVYSSFKAEFPLFQKIDVNGKNAAPLYKFLKSKKTGVIVDETKWNFAKILVDRQGSVVERYAPVTSPLQIEVRFSTFSKCFEVRSPSKSSMFLFCVISVSPSKFSVAE